MNPLATENWYYSASSLLQQESILPWLWDIGPGELSILTRHRGGGEGEGVPWPDSESRG